MSLFTRIIRNNTAKFLAWPWARCASTAQTKTQSIPEEETHFGFEKVKTSEKHEKVHDVFKTVAPSYDLMNDVMSLGVHRVWKDIFIHRLAPTRNTKLLDVAGGTGDIAFRYLDYMNNSKLEGGHVTVCDINQAMLDVGKQRCKDAGYDQSTVDWVLGNAECLDFKDESFTAYTVAFGIRNVTYINKVLAEAYRVLKPGGRFMCLEFSQLEYPTAQWFYDQYTFQVIPVLGQIIEGHMKQYRYLAESIKLFPNQETFKTMIEEAGFRQVTYENLTMGIVAIHSGFKI